MGRVRLDRFSPYFADPKGWGMVNPRPNRAFGYVYPFPQDVLARTAYYFEYDYADGRNPMDYVAPVLDAFDTWHQLQGTVTLRCWDRPDGVLILNDTRPCATTFQRRLIGLERQIYLYCDTGRTLQNIFETAAKYQESRLVPTACAAERTGLTQGVPDAFGPAGIRRMLEQWIADRIMVRLDDRYLSLALRAPSEV